LADRVTPFAQDLAGGLQDLRIVVDEQHSGPRIVHGTQAPGEGKIEREGGSLGQFAADLEATAVAMHDLVRDEQADAEPAVVARGSVYGAEVALEEAGLFLGGNSDARILPGHARGRPGALHGNREPYALLRLID